MTDDSLLRFYEIWTKKESQIKWEGKGLHKPLTSFSVFELNNRKQVIYHEAFKNDETICYICSTNQKPPAIRMTDTAVFLQNIMPLLN